MRKIRIICAHIALIFMAALTVLAFIAPAGHAEADSLNVDLINSYAITVSVNDDGSLAMDYRITWTVLSNEEGPLTWVKIGVPNKDVDDIKPLSSNIKKASYYSEDGKYYIRIDFNRSYHAGETFEFHYSFTQYNMFEQDNSVVQYYFTPGWFDVIDVNYYTISWKADNVRTVSPERPIIGDYYVWSGSLPHGQRTNIKVTYPLGAYNFKRHSVWHMPDSADGMTLLITATIIGVALLNIIMIGDTYHAGGGYFHHHHHGGGGGGGCACACACACAGGGRAGCSKKDFYGTKLSSSKVRAKLQEGADREC